MAMGGESLCLMQPFSYTTPALPPHEQPNYNDEENPIDELLGQSISLGRFMSDSLDWEKWSTFSNSNNKYVAEAENYSCPGSVAQKKAFFEAHYKSVAARKAAAAAALIHQTNQQQLQVAVLNGAVFTNHSNVQVAVDEPQQFPHNKATFDEKPNFVENGVKVELQYELNSTKQDLKVTNRNGTGHMEKSLLENCKTYETKPAVSSSCAKPNWWKNENMETPISKKAVIDSTDKTRFTPKSTHKSMNFTPVRELHKFTSSIMRKIDGSKASSTFKTSKDCSTLLRTPTTVPQSENTRERENLDSSASQRKDVRSKSKWNFLPTDFSKFLSSSLKSQLQSPNVSTPFRLRTEERAAKRKQLEEKFKASQAQRGQHQTIFKEKAETELGKLRQNFCFKARPLPDFYKDRKSSKETGNFLVIRDICAQNIL